MIGRRLSHYDIVNEISRGGMGVVYRGIDVNLGREVAIKVLPEDLVSDPDRRARLLQEARAASSLEHPHIAVIHEVGEAEGTTFVAMELIRGEKLSDIIARGPLPQARALTLAAEIAEGLARAHEKGIVHRDLKPSNVMVTDDGHAKIIDFGLAKMLEPISPEGSTVSVAAPMTREGAILGTAAYMSPEQARGARLDHRTDIFALGVTLYEMVAGRPAYGGRSSLETLQAVLTQPVPPLSASASGAGDATTELRRIIAKGTAKDPDERYQSMKDLVVDLRAARRRLESSEGLPHAAETAAAVRRDRPTVRPKTMAMAAGVLLIGLLAAAGLWWRNPQPQVTVNPSGKPALAVMYFENQTGDPSLDWMRTGLTDMLVTDLSQSAELEVLGTDRLVKILQDLRRADDRVLSADVVQQVADRARVENVLVGSYFRSGGMIRIGARLQEARTGRIIAAHSIDGAAEAELFDLVDGLTQVFRTALKPPGGGGLDTLLRRPGPGAAGLERDLADVTTSSIEAYRYYVEGLNLHERGLSARAIPLLEKAVEIDPDFAMAHAKLAVVNNNLLMLDKRDQHARLALERIDRLTSRERYYIEGFFYGLRPETTARSIESYRHGLSLHPEHEAMRHNLALHYLQLERYAEGIAESEELIRRGTSNATMYENLVAMLISTGETGKADAVARELVQSQPDSDVAHRTLGTAAIAAGQFDEARAAFERAVALEPLDFSGRVGLLSLPLLQARWADGADLRTAMSRADSPFERFFALLTAAHLELAHGRSSTAFELWDRGLKTPKLSIQPRTAGRNRLAAALLRQGRPAEALAQAELAVRDAEERLPVFQALELLAVAQAATGRSADAERTLAQLEARAKALPSDRELRRVHWARGEIALRRGDVARAVSELMQAQAALPRGGGPLGPPTSHMDYWLSAALANIRAGNDGEAARLLEHMQTRYERALNVEPWVRSFYLLGQVYERRGEAERARQQFARFVDLWGDGELERGWVEDARRKLGR
jgi:TolB-like protein/tetratricopeptide (TPR) repeat protein/predicted Ser/Thr protein kinase